MGIWIVPLIIVIVIICSISIASTRKWNKEEATVADGLDSQIPEAIEDHPFTLNPIIWIMFVSTFFIGIVIFYYATSS